MPGKVTSPHWFSETFGFTEGSYRETQDKFDFSDGVLRSKANGREFYVGPFEMLSLDELLARVESAPVSGLGGLTFNNVCGAAQTLHRDPGNAGAVFQVASQFNCLEMNEPGARPESGVTRYYSDATQGPACAIACQAGTVFRNYFVNGTGQGGGRQLDGLTDVGDLVDNDKEKYWRMVNGYCLPTGPGSIGKLSSRLKADAALREAARMRLKIGIHWDTEVTGKDHRVCQVFGSALPVAYAKSTRSQDWEEFGRVVLESMFQSTLAAAAVLAGERQARVKVYLTAVGGGAFGNRTLWITSAMERALKLFAAVPLDVMLVHYGSVPRGAYAGLETGRKVTKAPLREASSEAPRPTAEVPSTEKAPPAESESTDSMATKIAAAFALIDENEDGVIAESEMVGILQKLDPELSEDKSKAVFAAADANSDGEVHYAEFAAWIMSEDAADVASKLFQSIQ
eukprot:TRINITY_DN41463_c0_g1_i1.p1 TRINITY_DN41463_c0_g1~~TRINITY_DN41463_c0_g1_i1.p1  ORF type:complete len:456 (-),score=96.09 TRINITY_DN41463_c0_g1_i1:35-1402(-)